MSLSDVFLNVLTISASCAAVILVLLLFVPLLRKRVAARSIHVIFLLLALRLIIPFRYTFPDPVVTVREPEISVSLPETAKYTDELVDEWVSETMPETIPVDRQHHTHFYEAPNTVPRRSISLTEIAGMVWLTGVGACLLYWAVTYEIDRRRLLKGTTEAEDAELRLLSEVAADLELARTPALKHSTAVGSAVMLGIFKPVILLPEAPYGEDTLRFILRHELTHYKRKDIAAKLLFSFACAVHWFDPLVWLMGRVAKRNIELCCDEAVVRDLSPEERKCYGAVLLEAAADARPVAFSTSFGSGKKQLKQRLTGLFARKKTCAALVCVVLAGIVLAGGLVACESGDAADTPPAAENIPGREPQGEHALGSGAQDLLETHFYEHYDPDTCSVILTDLTGDGTEEMVVLEFHGREDGTVTLREVPLTATEYSYANLDVLGVQDGEVVDYFSASNGSSHVGWGYYSLCALADGSSALLYFSPYAIQGTANYVYKIFRFDEAGQCVVLERDSVEFTLDPLSVMGEVVTSDSRETVEKFLARVEELQVDSVPLVAYHMGNDAEGGSYVTHFCYWNADPEDAFAGDRSGMAEGEPHKLAYDLPVLPTDAETAMEYLERSIPPSVIWKMRSGNRDGGTNCRWSSVCMRICASEPR